eukprot:jgi/Psemu1/288591/fgenesh1_pg.273_\
MNTKNLDTAMDPQDSMAHDEITDGSNVESFTGTPTTPVASRAVASRAMPGPPYVLREWSYDTLPSSPIPLVENITIIPVEPPMAIPVSPVPPEPSQTELEGDGQATFIINGEVIQIAAQGGYEGDEGASPSPKRRKSRIQPVFRFFQRRKPKEVQQNNCDRSRLDTNEFLNFFNSTAVTTSDTGAERGDAHSLHEVQNNDFLDDCDNDNGNDNGNGSLIEASEGSSMQEASSRSTTLGKSRIQRVFRFFQRRKPKEVQQNNCDRSRLDTNEFLIFLNSTAVTTSDTGAERGDAHSLREVQSNDFLDDCDDDNGNDNGNGSLIEASEGSSMQEASSRSTTLGNTSDRSSDTGNKNKSQKKRTSRFRRPKKSPHTSSVSPSERSSKKNPPRNDLLSDRKPPPREIRSAERNASVSALPRTEPSLTLPSFSLSSPPVAASPRHEPAARATLVSPDAPHSFEASAQVTHIEEIEEEGVKECKKADKLEGSSTDGNCTIVDRLGEEREEQDMPGQIALGRKLRKEPLKNSESEIRPKLRVDVTTWEPKDTEVNFTMWDVQASKIKKGQEHLPNFGAHPDIQSLFFSEQSLYLLVYDMAQSNAEAKFAAHTREADRALQADIKQRVLAWVDCIARKTPNVAILPIAVIPSNLSSVEVRRRCKIMESLLSNHLKKFPENARPIVLFSDKDGQETVTRVSLRQENDSDLDHLDLEDSDLDHLEQLIVNDGVSAFSHVRQTVPSETIEIWKQLKARTTMLMKVDDFLGELPREKEFTTEAVTEALSFLANIGEVLYFNSDPESDLKHYVVNLTDSELNENHMLHNHDKLYKHGKLRGLVRGLCVFLQKHLKQKLSDARKDSRSQYWHHDMQFPYRESAISEILGDNSGCPLLSSEDMELLWNYHSYGFAVGEEPEPLFPFLEVLLVHSGVFVPLGINRMDQTYFIPSLLPQPSNGEFWTYNCKTPCKTTICHSWVFKDGAPSGLVEKIAVALLRDLYKSANPDAETPSTQAPHPISIIRANCWKDVFLIRCSTNNVLTETTEILVALTDHMSPLRVASDSMEPHWQRLIISAKGKSSDSGRKIWRGGYNFVLDLIEATIEATIKTAETKNDSNVERQVICPVCLQRSSATSASNAIALCWESVKNDPSDEAICEKGHRSDLHLIRGTAAPGIEYRGEIRNSHKNRGVEDVLVEDLLPSVVIVALWDDESKRETEVGSGFVANKKLGLVVTASHVVFKMDSKGPVDFGEKHHGQKNSKIKIGVMSSDGAAIWRYYAEIVAHDIRQLDACVLKITSTIEGHGAIILQNELKIASEYNIEQRLRLIGFNQTGQGKYEKGKHVNRRADYKEGTIRGKWKTSDVDDYVESDSSMSTNEFLPQEAIKVDFRTYQNLGYSGGPCVNDEGGVVGILSSEHPEDCCSFLVPSKGIKSLLNKAEKETREQNLQFAMNVVQVQDEKHTFLETQNIKYEEAGMVN